MLKMARAPENSVHPKTRREWRTWLKKNHSQGAGIWLITFKKETGKPRIEYDAAVEEALCFGWIDSKPNKLDDERSLLWFAPRKAGTGWSKLNKERVERLIAQGLMTVAGLKKVRAAKEDGSWIALDAVEALEIPEDLRIALERQSKAAEYFAAFPRSVKRGILEWIQSAKKAETRAARVAETAKLAKENQRANQWRGGKG
ncbi:MAG: YdeI/OmpD-associated family protein [Burkholderiales bacterium]